jgi:hypothetical protein
VEEFVWHLSIFRKAVEKIQLRLKSDNNGYFTWRPACIYDNLLNSSKLKNVTNRICRENQIAHFLFNIPHPRKSCPYEVTWKKYGRATDKNIAQRMRIACWITKAADTHSEYEIFLLFHGNSGYAKAPHCYIYTYIACLVLISQPLYWPGCALWTKPKQSSEIITSMCPTLPPFFPLSNET